MTASSITLQANPRERKNDVKHLRKRGFVPGVLYGYKVENQPVECIYQEFHKVFASAGESTVINLQVEGKTFPVLIHQIAYDPVTNAYDHIDFFVPDMSKEVTTNVPIRITGESLGVKELGGILVRNRENVTVKCLPKDLPHNITIDISVLENFHDTVTVSDLNLPDVVTLLEAEDEILISVQPPRKEEEVVVAPAAEGEAAEGEETTAEAAEGEEKDEKKEGGEEKGSKEKNVKGKEEEKK